MKRWTWWSCVGCLMVLSFSGVSQAAGKAAKEPAPPARSSRAYSPDPPALRSADQWELTFHYANEKVELVRARRIRLRKAIVTPRNLGRYAVELLRGPAVIERVRFNFPMLGANEQAGQPKRFNDPPRFETKAHVTYRVLVPDTPRAARARLVDRATGVTMMIPWPPQEKKPNETKAPADKPSDAVGAKEGSPR